MCVEVKGRGLQPVAAYDLARRAWGAGPAAEAALPEAAALRSLGGYTLPEALRRRLGAA